MVPNCLIRREMQEKKFLAAAAENGGGQREWRYRRHFLFKYFLLTYLKRFCFNIFKSLVEALNVRYTLINENLKKNDPPQGWL